MEATFCKFNKGVNVRICTCPHCLKKKKPTIQERILAILQDHEWHTQKDVAIQANLIDDEENYIDIGRDIRNMRREDGGSYPIDAKHIEGTSYEYRLLPEAEAAEFWEKRRLRIAAIQSGSEVAQELAEEIERLRESNKSLTAAQAALASEILSLKDENRFLSEYVKEQDAEIERLKHGFAANARAEPASVSR